MTALLMVPALVSVALFVAGARLGRLLPPTTAVRLLTLAALVGALSTGFVLSVAAFISVGQLGPVAALGGWSAGTVAAGAPLPLLLGISCGATAVALMVGAVRRVGVAGRDLVAAAATCRRLGPGTGGLVVVHDNVPDAYALPGISGRVVVSTAMMAALPAGERAVLLAHEAAHLRHHHHVYVQLVELSAAANPMLRPLVEAVRAGVERWADEDAATVVGDRALTARAVARATLARHTTTSAATTAGAPVWALRMAAGTAVARTQALLAPAPRPRHRLAATVAAALLAATVSAIDAGTYTEHLFEVAQFAFASHR
ncbi:MAG: M56 family metallopeptidase [Knoellia sp.]